MICKNCGVKIPDGCNACRVCGEKATPQWEQTEQVGASAFQTAGDLRDSSPVMGHVVYRPDEDMEEITAEQTKFCQICGRKLNNGAKFCAGCGSSVLYPPQWVNVEKHPPMPPPKKKRSVFKRIVAIAAVLALVVGVAYFFPWRSGGPSIFEDIQYDGFLATQNVSSKITDNPSAIRVAAEVGQDAGFKNAMDEMSVQDTVELNKSVYYILSQNYRGVPVYGRSAIFCTGEDGAVSSLISNAIDIGEDFSISPKMTAENARQAAVTELASEMEYVTEKNIWISDNAELQIYAQNDGSAALVYAMKASVVDEENGGSYELIVDANTGRILKKTEQLQSLGETHQVESSDGEYTASVTWDENDKEYVLQDTERNMMFLNFKGNSHKILSVENLVTVFQAAGDGLSDFDDDAICFAARMTKIYDYYNGKFKETGFGALVAGYYEGCKLGRNSEGGYESGRTGVYGVVYIGAAVGTGDVDVMAHEYTHVICHARHMRREGSETGAISEGMADIFGCLIESDILDRPIDWRIEADLDPSIANRNIANPAATNNTTHRNAMKGEGHEDSTLVSHPAYLMWKGMDGKPASKLSEDTLAELHYRTILMLSSVSTLEEYRTAVYLAAVNMGLSEEQIECVHWAFDQVGIGFGGEVDYVDPENVKAYDRYIAAGEATVVSGSWTEKLSMTVNMTASDGKVTTKEKMTLESNLNISGYQENDTSKLQMSGSVNAKGPGLNVAYTVTYADGIAHYNYTKPTVTLKDVAINPDYFKFDSLTEDMILSSSVSGNTVKLTVDGAKMTSAGLPAVEQMGMVENLEYGDISVEAVIDSTSGKIDTVTMRFSASMRVQGYDAEADYEIVYQFLS